jgi:hypothetical protein
MITVWIIGVIILGSIAAYFLGRISSRDFVEFGVLIIFVVVFWPVFLVIGSILAPFAIPFILGRRKRNKNKKND